LLTHVNPGACKANEVQPGACNRALPETKMKVTTRDYRWNLHQASTPARGLSEAAMMAGIGRDLRTMYNELLREPIPDHLVCIVRELEKSSRRPH
jgi:hypothetical protein